MELRKQMAFTEMISKYFSENPDRLKFDENRVYISGRVTGIPYGIAKAAFDDAEVAVLEMFPGAEIFNPTAHIHPGASWVEAMRLCKMVLPTCGKIFMMRSWPDSRGAVIELQDAKQLGISIFYEPGADFSNPTINAVLDSVHEVTGVTIDQMRSRTHNQEISEARIIAAYAMHCYGIRIKKIDEIFCRKRQFTWMYCKNVDKYREINYLSFLKTKEAIFEAISNKNF